jgi:glycerol-3-phosphate dehydrogenase (NAD(P)+)
VTGSGPVTVVGAGSCGTALAIHLARAGRVVTLWAREPEVVDGIRTARRNPWYLADVDMPAGITATADLREATRNTSLLIVAVPSEYVGVTLKALDTPAAGTAIVSATKGFDPVHHLRMTEIVTARFPDTRVAALSGPTFAREVARAQPTAAVLGAPDVALTRELQERLGTREFRLYTNRDVIGVETGGALKNVMAIATGIADGLGLGENARAALVTRGLAEMTRLAVALGGHAATLAGLSGLGDLVLTATGSLSRNRALGMALAAGRTIAQVEAETRMVAEGVPTVRSALALAERHGVSLPICREVGAVLFEGKSPADALASLLARVATREDHGDA